MEACFRHWLKIKKAIVTFYLTIQIFFLPNASYKVQFWGEKKTDMFISHNSDLTRNCEFMSCNSEEKSQNCKYVSGNSEKKRLWVRIVRCKLTIVRKKKSELWDKKLQLPFLFILIYLLLLLLFIHCFNSVAETGFHRN